MKYSNETKLDEINKLNSIKNPDKYLYFCHLKGNTNLVDEVEIVDPISGETKMKEKLSPVNSLRTAEIGNFLHNFLFQENAYFSEQKYSVYGSLDFLSENFSYFKTFIEVKNSNSPFNKLYALLDFGDEKGIWRVNNIPFSKIVWQIGNIREKIGSAKLCEVLEEYKQSFLITLIKDQLTEAEQLYLEI